MKKILISMAAFLLASFPASAQLTNPTVSGPTSSTVNAFPLWGDATGDALVNTPLLLDTSLLTTTRTMQWPDFSGKPLVNNVGDTLQNTLIDDNVTFFADGAPTRQMNLFLGGVATGDTITFHMPSDSSGLTPGARSIIIPNFATGQTSITLLTNSGVQTVTDWNFMSPTVGDSTGGGTLELRDFGINANPRPDQSFFGIYLYDHFDQLNYENTNGDIIQVASFTKAEVDFGTTPISEKLFTITDSQINAKNTFYTSLDYHIEAFVPRVKATGKTYIDEMDMDSFFVNCTPNVGSVTCMVRCLTGQFTGKLPIDYRMTQQNE